MAITLKAIWGNGITLKDGKFDPAVMVERPWGFEVRADFIDSVGGKIYNETFLFKEKPEQKSVDAAVAAKINALDIPVTAKEKAVLEAELADANRQLTEVQVKIADLTQKISAASAAPKGEVR